MEATMAKTPTKLTEKLKALFSDHPRQELADAFGVHRQAITQYLNGSIPGPGVLLRIARHFKVSLEWLVDDEMPATKPLTPAQALSLYDLIEEHAKRYRAKTLEAHAELERCHEVDWWKLAEKAFSRPLDSVQPEVDAAPDYCVPAIQDIDIYFDPYFFVSNHLDEMPCPDIAPIDVRTDALRARWSEFIKNNQGARWLGVLHNLQSVWTLWPNRRPKVEELRKAFVKSIIAKKAPGPETVLFTSTESIRKGITPVFNKDFPLVERAQEDNESKSNK